MNASRATHPSSPIGKFRVGVVSSWVAGQLVRQGLQALCRLAIDHPHLRRLLLVETLQLWLHLAPRWGQMFPACCKWNVFCQWNVSSRVKTSCRTKFKISKNFVTHNHYRAKFSSLKHENEFEARKLRIRVKYLQKSVDINQINTSRTM